jgi:plastocyanin
MRKAMLFALLLVLLASGCVQQEGKQTQESAPPAEGAAVEGSVIRITAAGFAPSMLAVRAGETVTFVNNDSTAHWPASDIHPAHGAYPQQGGCIGSAFDACRALAQGETFSFTFNHRGTWGYHDHLNPALKGTIIVE